MDVKQQILEKAEALFLRYGLKSVTMDDIARKLGISKKTLYQYVENKTDLIAQIMMAHIEAEKALMEEISTCSGDAIEELLRIAKYVIQELRKLSPTVVYDLQKYYLDIWLSVQKLHSVYIYELIKKNIEKGKKQGVFRANIHAPILAKIYVTNTMAIVDEDIFPLKEYDKKELFTEFIKYHIHGLASEKGLELYKKHTQGKEF